MQDLAGCDNNRTPVKFQRVDNCNFVGITGWMWGHHLADCAGIVAPQNLHFTDTLFWSADTIWPLLHIGHMRLRLRTRKSDEKTNGNIPLTPDKT